MASALIILPEGAEEIEFVASVDILRRAGINVTVAGLLDTTEAVTCSRDVKIVPDVKLSEVIGKSFDAVVLPGGLNGAKNMAKSDLLKTLLKKQEADGKFIAAICASPALVFNAHEIALKKKICCYPTFQNELSDHTYIDEEVVVDGKIITSQGPSTAIKFALKIVENLVGAEKAENVAKGILLLK